MKSYLADVNVWVAIAHEAHMHHHRAREWFHRLDRDQAWFCRFTQMGLLRLLTNYKVMGDRARTQRGAWKIVDEFHRNGRVQYLDEPPEVTAAFRSLTQRNLRGHSSWSDAYIAAVAQRSGFLTLAVDALILA